MNVFIRHAKPSEAMTTQIIKHKSWHSAYSEIFTKSEIDNHFESKRIDGTFIKRVKKVIMNKDIFVADENGVPVAMMKLGKIKPNAEHLEIEAIYALPSHQRLGIGKLLFEHTKSIALKNNIHKIKLFALKLNKIGCSFYQKNGGKIVGEIKKTFCGKEVELVEFEFKF